MSNHSEQPFNDQHRKMMQDLLDTSSFRGPLGGFPKGKLTPSDEGALQFAVTQKDGRVVLEFGTPVAWIGMTPQDAADLASTLMRQAREAARKTGETVAFTL